MDTVGILPEEAIRALRERLPDVVEVAEDAGQVHILYKGMIGVYNPDEAFWLAQVIGAAWTHAMDLGENWDTWIKNRKEAGYE